MKSKGSLENRLQLLCSVTEAHKTTVREVSGSIYNKLAAPLTSPICTYVTPRLCSATVTSV